MNIKIIVVTVITTVIIGIGIFFGYTYLQKSLNGTTAESTVKTEAPKAEVNALTFYDWWTSPSESAAINKLISVFTDKYPDVAVAASPIIGGGGFKMLPTIKSLASAGQAPDAFQAHAGYEARPFFDAGLLSQVDAIWASEGLESVIPSVIRDMNKFDGHYYSIPVNVHRSNVLWFNKSILGKNGIDATKINDWDSFFKAADKLRSNGVKNPVAMGEGWTASHVFETILASLGVDPYQDWINGKITESSNPNVVKAFETFKKYLTYVNKDHNDLSWDAATKKVISGEAAFNIMGDWANGEFKLVGMKYDKDYGSVAAPGTSGMFGLVIDTFQHPKGISHPTNSDRWLKTVASVEGQDAFNPIKGSISVRTDSDVTKYDAYQQGAISDFKNAAILYPSVVHGSGAPEAFKIKLNDVVTQFMTDLDVTKATEALSATTKSIISSYNKVWTLKK